MNHKLLAAALCSSTLLAAPALAQTAVVIVNPKNTGTLTIEQISGIFLGKTAELVGVDLPDNSPVRDVFYHKVTGKDGAQLKAYWAKLVFTGKAQPLKEFASDAEVKKFVASNLTGIGYIDKASVDGSVRVMLSP